MENLFNPSGNILEQDRREKMIYTLTLNPAIDLFIKTREMKKNVVNRTDSYDIQANGKGVNVSFILHQLGIVNTALGVGGGFTLDYISSFLTKNEINNCFFKDDGLTRINVFARVVHDNCEYKLVNPGPAISKTTMNKLNNKIKALTSKDWLCVCGSFSRGIRPSYIEELSQMSQEQGFKLIIDTSYPEVVDSLKYQPYLIKPNAEELASWFNVPASNDIKDVVGLGKKAQQAGAQNVLVSLGGDGALLLTPDKILYGNAPHINVLNTAGSGDTMLGTFVAGRFSGLPDQVNFVNSIVAGSDTARSPWLTKFENTKELKEQVDIRDLSEQYALHG